MISRSVSRGISSTLSSRLDKGEIEAFSLFLDFVNQIYIAKEE